MVLSHALPKQDEEYLIDEIDRMLDKLSPTDFMTGLNILYKQNLSKKNDIELFVLFIRGLRENSFFEYAHFVKSLNG